LICRGIRRQGCRFWPSHVTHDPCFQRYYGPGYRSRRFRRLCRRLGLKRLYTRPYTPRTNGKAERFIQTLLREWAYARTYQNADHRARHLPAWLHHYNWHRPHASLGYAPPVSRAPLPVNNLVALHT